MTGQSKEAAWRVFGLAGKAQHKREHRRRQRVQHRAAAEMIVSGLAAHQGDEAGELRGGLLLSGVSAGVHDQARRQVAARPARVASAPPCRPVGRRVAAARAAGSAALRRPGGGRDR